MIHKPVLLQEVIEGLNPKKDMIFLDGTFGSGGHSKKLTEILDGNITVIALDKDNESLENAKNEWIGKRPNKIITDNVSFTDFDKTLEKNNIQSVDAVLLDLGFSSDQMDYLNRGLSFNRDEPLIMSLKNPLSENDLTAKEIVNNWEEENIRDIIKYYGEERFASRIARNIVQSRKISEIKTTFDLVEIIMQSVPNFYKNKKIHPATKTFQALRITVNNELQELEKFLNEIIDYLNKNGRIAIISFHSLEDRIVKKTFKKYHSKNFGKIITKKPITATDKERKENPRSRSAKLRIFEKNV